MKWQPIYATGLPAIDEQHKTLFASSEQFRETMEAGEGIKTYDLFLEFLRAYAKAHFTYEDECMLARRCPIAARNRREHAGFLQMVDEETRRYDRDGFDRTQAYALLDRVDGWLVSHIGRIDVQLRDSPG